MTVAAGIAGFATTRLLGRQTAKQIQQTTVDLKSQFEAMQKAISMPKPHSEDEFGGLASSFNEMARVTRTTLAAQRKGIRRGASQEELQRQVIRLLDDVEGQPGRSNSASRGQC